MANGILKDEATYYENSEKYSGDSGSSTNMWVIEDTYDFITVAESQDAGRTYMRLVNDIDFNEHDIYKKGFDNKIFKPITYYYLYGDGHKIKNIVATNCSDYVFPFSYIENVDFVNLVSINCNGLFIIKVVGETNNCNFGVFFSDGRFYFDSGTFNDCTFNIKGKIRDGNCIIGQNVSFNRCHFNFDINSRIKTNDQSRGFFYGSGESNPSNFTNCYFTGRVKDSGTLSPYWSGEYNTMINCYFAFEYIGIRDFSTGKATCRTCFVDKELFEKNNSTWTNQNGIIALTTAQAQDPEYLNSIGFAVVPIE